MNSFIHWGEKFIEKLDGMFSIIIYDKIKDEFIIMQRQILVKSHFITTKIIIA